MFYKDMMKILFSKTPDNVLDRIENILENNCKRFAVNTPLRFAHFIAQVREEIGPELKAVRENLNYKEEVLSRYVIDPITKKKKKVGLFSNFTPELAEMYGRDEDTPVANQVAIANIAYANKLGNGKEDSNNNGQLDEDDDGWKYRGAGALQITGKSNFQEVQKRIDKYLDGMKIDILNSKDINTLEGFFIAGLGFWIWNDLYKIADKGTQDLIVDQITSVINKKTESYAQRKAHFNKIKHLIK